MIYFSELKDITGGIEIHSYADHPIEILITDSRKLSTLSHAIFIAIKGEFHNGHDFIPDLFAKGIRQFMIEEGHEIDPKIVKNSNVVQVTNSISALQDLVAFHRSKFTIPIIGITGSNGKTIVKEWLSQMLSQRFKVLKSPKSYNSQLGVPLSVWPLNEAYEIGVFEAGISNSGQMQHIARVMKPDIGIFTNIGPAHDKGFGSLEEKISEKLKLFLNSQVIIYCKDHLPIHETLKQQGNLMPKLFTWSRHQSADVLVKDIYEEGTYGVLDIHFNHERMLFKIPFQDEASYENLIHCICTCLYLNIGKETIKSSLLHLTQVSMRLALKQAINSCYVIDDTYNNDYAGLKIAIDFLMHQHQKPKKSIILTDILEAGLEKSLLYRQVADLVNSKSVHQFIGVGEDLVNYKSFFEGNTVFFDDKAALLNAQIIEHFNDEIILIKGARKFSMEEVVSKLQKKIHGTVMEINLDAMTHNLNYFRSKLKPRVRMLVMVKAFAYGSGFLEIANLLQFHGVDYLGVAYPDEGVTLRENGITLPIMVMNASQESYFKLIEHNLEPEVYSLKMIESLIDFLNQIKKPIKVHIKIETGMHRLGFALEDLEGLVSRLKACQYIAIASIFSHLAGSEDEIHNQYSQRQFDIFEKGFKYLEKNLGIKTIKHILKTSGIIRFPDKQFDMVRLGIGLHGIGFNQSIQKDLEPVASLKTTISQIIHLKKGETIGYNRAGIAGSDMKIATIAIGYADGFDRRFSGGQGYALVKGKKAAVVGNICMDMSMIDITNIEAKEGDEVTIFGDGISLIEIANNIGTIPYEILTKVSDRVKRIFYTE